MRDFVCEKKMDTRNQHGNRAGQVDAYGNPITGTGQETGYGHDTPGHGSTGHGTTGDYTGTGEQAQMTRPEKENRGGGILHRSGSSSTSSSEDDGVGGRRKKGLKEKIKEKVPGGHKTDEYGQAQATTGGYGKTTGTTGYGGVPPSTAGHQEPEKKGMTEKIKEKLPGQH